MRGGTKEESKGFGRALEPDANVMLEELGRGLKRAFGEA